MKASNFVIIQDGQVIGKGENITVLDNSLTTEDVPKQEPLQWNATLKVKMSKRKSRKFRYFIERLCKPRDRKYIPKREFIDMIFRQYVDTGDFNARLHREEYMKYSKRELRIMNNGLFIYTLIHSDFNTPPDPEGHKGDEYFGNPMKNLVKLPQGFEKGGV